MSLTPTIFSWQRQDSFSIGMTDRSAPLQPVQLDQTLNAALSLDLRRSLKYLLEGWTPRQLELQALRLSEDEGSDWEAYNRKLLAVDYVGPVVDDLTADQIESDESLLPPDGGLTGSIDGDVNDTVGQEVAPVQAPARLTGDTLIHFYPDTLYNTSMTEERFYSNGNSSRLEFGVTSRPPKTLSLEFLFTSRQDCLTVRRRLPQVQVDRQVDDGLDLIEVKYTNAAGQQDVGVTDRLRALARKIVDTFPNLSSQRDKLSDEQYR